MTNIAIDPAQVASAKALVDSLVEAMNGTFPQAKSAVEGLAAVWVGRAGSAMQETFAQHAPAVTAAGEAMMAVSNLLQTGLDGMVNTDEQLGSAISGGG